MSEQSAVHWTQADTNGFPHGPQPDWATPGTQAFRDRVQRMRDERHAREQAEKDARRDAAWGQR